jgi:hypothetical protein
VTEFEGRLRRWWYRSRFLDLLFYVAQDGRSRTPSLEQQRREEMLAAGHFPARLLIGKSERALTIQGSVAPLLPKPKRNWLSVEAIHSRGHVRIYSIDPTLSLDQTYEIKRATLGGHSTPLDGPTDRITVVCADHPDLVLVVGRRQADRIVRLLNETS